MLEGEDKTPLATCPGAGHTLPGIMSWYFYFFQVRERIILNHKGLLITNYVTFRDIAESMVRDSLEETIRDIKPHMSHSSPKVKVEMQFSPCIAPYFLRPQG